jgi:hypothetical protein
MLKELVNVCTRGPHDQVTKAPVSRRRRAIDHADSKWKVIHAPTSSDCNAELVNRVRLEGRNIVLVGDLVHLGILNHGGSPANVAVVERIHVSEHRFNDACIEIIDFNFPFRSFLRIRFSVGFSNEVLNSLLYLPNATQLFREVRGVS